MSDRPQEVIYDVSLATARCRWGVQLLVRTAGGPDRAKEFAESLANQRGFEGMDEPWEAVTISVRQVLEDGAQP
jgi:hypothetical protein